MPRPSGHRLRIGEAASPPQKGPHHGQLQQGPADGQPDARPAAQIPAVARPPSSSSALACNRKFRTANGEDREEVTFVDITAFGKQAEVINQYMTKGKPIFIEGRLKYDSWEDKKAAGSARKLTVVVENFQFVGGRDGGGGGGGGGGGDYRTGVRARRRRRRRRQPPAPQRPAAARPAAHRGTASAAAPPEQPFGEEQQFKEDDIPF